jgi:hypothetical protein
LPSLEEIQDQAETFLRLYLIQELGGSKQIPESDFRAVQVAGIAYVLRGRIERAWKEINKKSQETLNQEAKRELINDLRRVERASDACNMLHCLSVIRGQMKKWLCRSRRISGRISRNWRMSASGCELPERKAWVGAQTLQAASKGGVARKNRSNSTRLLSRIFGLRA